MKTIIAGGRGHHLTDSDFYKLTLIDITEVVSGGARGVDRDGELYAEHQNIPIKRFIPSWDKWGKAAGIIRNGEMAKYAEACVLFPGGKGTNNMYEQAKRYGLIIYDYRKG